MEEASSSGGRTRTQSSAPMIIDYAYPNSPRSPQSPSWEQPPPARTNSSGPSGPLTAETLPATFDDTPSSRRSLSSASSSRSSETSIHLFHGYVEVPSWPTFRTSHIVLLVPVSFVLAPLFLLLPVFAWPPVTPFPPDGTIEATPRYPRPVEWVPIGLGAIVHAAARAFRQPLVEVVQRTLLCFPASDRDYHSPRRRKIVESLWRINFEAAPVILGSVMTELVRLLGIYVLALVELPPDSFPSSPPPGTYPLLTVDRVFFPAFYFGLGYAFCESVLAGGYDWVKQVLLYKDVLPGASGGLEVGRPAIARKRSGSGPVSSTEHAPRSTDDVTPKQSGFQMHSRLPSTIHDLPPDERTRLLSSVAPAAPPSETSNGTGTGTGTGEDEEGWQRIVVSSREREALERTLGAPLWGVPWFVVLVWRLDALLLTLGTTLFIALPFLPFSAWPSSPHPSYPSLPLPIHLPLLPTFILLCLTRTLITLIWTFRLQGWGLVGVSYATLLVGMGVFLGGVAAWGGLE